MIQSGYMDSQSLHKVILNTIESNCATSKVRSPLASAPARSCHKKRLRSYLNQQCALLPADDGLYLTSPKAFSIASRLDTKDELRSVISDHREELRFTQIDLCIAKQNTVKMMKQIGKEVRNRAYLAYTEDESTLPDRHAEESAQTLHGTKSQTFGNGMAGCMPEEVAEGMQSILQ